MMDSTLWHEISDTMWLRVASALGVAIHAAEWAIAKTLNTQIVSQVLSDAQNEAMFMAISEKAGSGKTASINHYKANDQEGMVFVLQCEEWHKRPFLFKLSETLGVATRADMNVDALTDGVVKFFKRKAKDGRPLLVLDEADKLRPAALRFLIVLYNRLEDEIGLVVAGTEFLKRHIQAGVKRAHKGYDEIDSRLGRTYIELVGAQYNDVVAICQANGLADTSAIGRVWDECKPEQRSIEVPDEKSQTGKTKKYIQVVDDLRRVKRIVKRERLALSRNGY
ncbi:ATP-binding protein [Fibrella sp. WM1]